MFCLFCTGVTPAVSVRNLKQWLDAIVSSIARHNPLVADTDGSRLWGFYHRLSQEEHSLFTAAMSFQGAWTGECTGNHSVRQASVLAIIVSD